MPYLAPGFDPQYFNVINYGADPTYTNDSTTAIQAAINAAVAAGGGVIWFPRGKYKIAGALQDTSGARSQLVLPSRAIETDKMIGLEFKGECIQSHEPTTVGANPLPTTGVVIQSTVADDAGTGLGAIIGCAIPTSSYEYSQLIVRVDKVTFRTMDPPRLSCLNFLHISEADISDVVCDNGNYDTTTAAQCTYSNAVGIRMPGNLNGAWNHIHRALVFGYYSGIYLGEHTVALDIECGNCGLGGGISIGTTTGSALILKYKDLWQPVGIAVSGSGEVRLDIGQWLIEKYQTTGGSPQAWQVRLYDLYDASNRIYGKGRISSTINPAGQSNWFEKYGGHNFVVEQNTLDAVLHYGQQTVLERTLTDASSITWNLDTSPNAVVTLGGNRTLANPSNMQPGGKYKLRVINGSTYTLAYGSKYKWPADIAPVITASAGSEDILEFESNGYQMFGRVVASNYAIGASGTAIADTFTGTDSTLLANRALSTGGVSWESITGDASISSNTAKGANGGSESWLCAESGVSDCTISTVWKAGTNGIVFRKAADGTFWFMIAGGTTFQLWQWIQSYVKKASATISSLSGDHTISVVLSSDTISCKLDGTEQIYWQSDWNQNATKHGIYLGDTSAQLDTFTVTKAGTGTGSVVTATTPSLIPWGSTTLGTGLSMTAGVIAADRITQNSQSAAYTTVLGDAGKHLLHPSADTTARTFTIDSNANVPYAVGTVLTFVNQASAGVLTIAITSDTMRLAGTGATGSRTLAANGIATALKVSSVEWLISGTGLT